VTVTKFEDLEIWKLARELAVEVRKACLSSKEFSGDYALKNQIHRSAGSIMDNIAEGFERNGRNEFITFLSISKGSAGELRSQLYRALDNNYLAADKFDLLLNKVLVLSRKIAKMIGYLKTSEYKGAKYKNRSET